MDSARDTLAGGFPHSDICGSKLDCQLPAAYRRLPRPSSPVVAKASTVCTSSLDPITLTWALRPNQSHKLSLMKFDAIATTCPSSEHVVSFRIVKEHSRSSSRSRASTPRVPTRALAFDHAFLCVCGPAHASPRPEGAERAQLPEGVLVEVNGIEPMTPCLQSRCSPS